MIVTLAGEKLFPPPPTLTSQVVACTRDDERRKERKARTNLNSMRVKDEGFMAGGGAKKRISDFGGEDKAQIVDGEAWVARIENREPRIENRESRTENRES